MSSFRFSTRTCRIHDATYTTSDKLMPDEFELHGRRWRVVGPTKARRARGDTQRMLCVATGANSRLPPPSASKSQGLSLTDQHLQRTR